MKRICNDCRHSAVCLADPRGFPQHLLGVISRHVYFNLVDDFLGLLRERLLAAIPLGCPLLPDELRDSVRVDLEPTGRNIEALRLKLIWPATYLRGVLSVDAL